MSSAPASLPVFLTIDVGPALATLGEHHRPDPDWAPTLQGLAVLRDALPRLEDRLGLAVPVTWFVRADAFVARQWGSRVAVVRRFAEAMAGSSAADEVGWLPHLPGADGAPIHHDDLRATHAELLGELPRIDSVRMGDLFHDDTAMAILDELGVRIDSTAVPGRIKVDPGWHVDWRDTPTHAYHPSCADYRRPGDPHHDLLEVPLTMLPMQAPYDAVPLPRYVNPCFLPGLLWPRLQHTVVEAPWLTTLLHPDELVAGMARGHPMVAYSPQVFADNVAGMVEAACAAGRTVSFHALRDFTSATAPQGPA